MNHRTHSSQQNMHGMKHEGLMQGHTTHIQTLKTRFFVCLILTIPVLVLSEIIQNWLQYSLTIPNQHYILLSLATIIYVYGGWPFLTGLIQELKQRQPGMMTLVGTAISVAFFFSTTTVFFSIGSDFFWELVTLIDIMLLGHWLEARSVLGASRAIEELVKVMPTTAHVIIDEQIVDIPAAHLKLGNIVLVRPGEKIPSDGTVIEGESYVDESLLTGESKPIHKKTNDSVIGGAINGDGSLRTYIDKTGEATYLSQVVQLVRKAQESKSHTQDLANRAAALLFYVAIISGILAFAIWGLIGDIQFALTRSVTVLVIACPHALGLAIPLVVALSTSITAKNGILIRDRKAFEDARAIKTVVFDKTGTLTTGQFGVTNIIRFTTEKEVLAYTASVEIHSEHVIAKAIVNYAKAKKVKIPESKYFIALPGKGVQAKIDGTTVYVGSPALLKDLNIQFDDKRIDSLQNAGKTVVFTVIENKLAGAFALADKIRKESRSAVEELKRSGVKVYMLTGDSKKVASAVAKDIGVDEYFAEVLPDQKASKITSIKQQGYRVAMVGDGINDAPALVTADIGIAIGAGTDVAIESADIILVKNNPQDVPKAINFSRRTYSKMVQNLWWAAGYNIFAIPLAAGLFTGFGIVIDPAVGAILMSLSTILVAINSQTLR
ncbi:MAG: copper-translocating P-type ATPase [Crenarchaeota archaeon]|nr:copper-translocating P-type ATPase [Thermoproteota archaeon]